MTDEPSLPEPGDPVLAELRRALRGPVATILTGLQGLDIDALTPDQQRLVTTMRRAARELDGTVDDLDHALVVLSGRYMSHVAECDPGAVLREVVAYRGEKAIGFGATVAIQVAADVPRRVPVDAATLERVAGGLVDHALPRAGDGHVMVELLAEPAGDLAGPDGGLQLRVSWEGDGPPPGNAHALGLALATRQATLSGGATGAIVGGGTGIWVRLPYAGEPEPLPDDPRGPRPLRVMIVEDDPFSSMMAELQVELAGHLPLPVTSAAAAMDVLAGGDPPDLVLMDRNLGDADGVALTRQVRAADARWSDVPIIGLSASGLDSDRATCLDAGMDDYLVKPLSAARLEHAIADLIADDRLHDRRQRPSDAERSGPRRPRDDDARAVTAIREHLEGLTAELGDVDVVAQICERFLAELPNRLGLLAVAALRRDRDQFRAVAHRFRGAAAAVGGAVLIEAIDAAKEATDAQDLPRVAEAIRQAAMKVRLGLQSWLEDSGRGSSTVSPPD